MLDPNIPLSARGPKPFNALIAGRQAAQNEKTGQLRNELMSAQTRVANAQANELDAMSNFKSVLQTSELAESILGAEGEVAPEQLERAKQVFRDKIELVEGRGGDASNSRRGLALLEAGDIDAVRNGFRVMNETAIHHGLRKAPEAVKLPKSVQEFLFAQENGFTGSYEDFLKLGKGGIQEDMAKIQLQREQFELSQRQRDADIKNQERQDKRATEEKQSASARRHATDLLTLAKEVASDREGIDAISGFSGNAPTVRPSTKAFLGKMERLVNSLALENTDKLKGSISEGELQLLSESISAVREGATFESNQEALQSIVNRIEDNLGLERSSFTKRRTGRVERRRQRQSNEPSDEELLNF